ncbi:MAG TPA: efflux RND transporter periplasmic adaptor subunit [Xanthobacteraceae bacterium]|jgi:multidrug efflux system membrane fusion protein
MTRGGRIGVALVSLVLVAGVVSYYWWPLPISQLSDQASKGKGKGKGGRGFRAARGSRNDIVPVLALDARNADVPVYLDGVGTAKALNTVLVRPQVDGKLISMSFTEGQDVAKGFVLAKIDPTTYQAQYDQAVGKKAQDEAQLGNAQLDLERYARLAQTNAVNKQQLDTQRAMVAQLQAQVKIDQASIENAEAVLSYTDIVAPLAGRTGIRMVDAGNIVHASDATGIVVITQIHPISVFFSLPQQNLPELTTALTGGTLPIEALGADGNPIDSGKVLVLDNQVDQATGTVKLKAEFPNEHLQLWPGQFINVRVLIDTLRQVVVVPTAAVQRGPTGPYVYFVKDDSTVAVRPISVAQQDDRQAVIASGLDPGEIVVTSGFARLSEGTTVSVSSPDESTPVGQGNGKGNGKAKRVQASGDTTTTTP